MSRVTRVEDILQHISLFDYADDFDNVTQFVRFLLREWKSVFKRCLNTCVDLLIGIGEHLDAAEQSGARGKIFSDVFMFCTRLLGDALVGDDASNDDVSACVSLILNGRMDDDVVSVFDKVTRFMIENKLTLDVSRVPDVIQLILNYKYG